MPVEEVAARVFYLPLRIANVYFVGRPEGGWTLVDTGHARDARRIVEAAEAIYGPGRGPESIVLTHGHADHAGSAAELSDLWGAPVLAHPLELPYLQGKSEYPPLDLTVGGFMATLGRVIKPAPVYLGDRVRALDAQSAAHAMPGWKWVHTPGHAPGHLAFFRREDEVLLAGDAMTTMNLDSFWGTATRLRGIWGPPALSTYDWIAAADSVRRLADLHPSMVACGHGAPMTGDRVVMELAELATVFPIPRQGRYVRQPAVLGESGVMYLPPKPVDPLAGAVVGLGIATAAGVMFALARHRRTRRATADTQAQAS